MCWCECGKCKAKEATGGRVYCPMTKHSPQAKPKEAAHLDTIYWGTSQQPVNNARARRSVLLLSLWIICYIISGRIKPDYARPWLGSTRNPTHFLGIECQVIVREILKGKSDYIEELHRRTRRAGGHPDTERRASARCDRTSPAAQPTA